MANTKPLIPDNLTIHGASYLADAKSSKVTKSFWIFVLILSLVCFIFCAIRLCMGYIDPDIGIKISNLKSHTLPFPAITICPQSKFKTGSFNYTELFLQACNGNFTYSSDEEQKIFEMAMQICPKTKDSLNALVGMELFTNDIKLSGSEMIDMLEDTAVIDSARFSFDKEKSVEFNRIFTEEGICFTFNFNDYSDVFKEGILHKDFDRFRINKTSNWSPSDGYIDDSPDAYPLRIANSKRTLFKTDLIQDQSDDCETCTGKSKGYLVYWHMPNELPNNYHSSLLLALSKERHIILKATSIKTSKDLMRLDPKKRFCYFENERELEFFKTYSRSNCKIECQAKETLKTCGCVQFWMPRRPETPVCNISQFSCYYTIDTEANSNDPNSVPCDCYPVCNHIRYDLVLTEEDVNDEDSSIDCLTLILKKYADELDLKEKLKSMLSSKLTIQFSGFLMEEHERYIAYGIQHFISDCGGLLGLFLGCSILSVIEIFYHFVIRLVDKKKGKGKGKDDDDDDDEEAGSKMVHK